MLICLNLRQRYLSYGHSYFYNLELSRVTNIIGPTDQFNRKKAIDFKDDIKIGRTHLMDAIPVTMGDEFGSYLFSVIKSKEFMIRSRGT